MAENDIPIAIDLDTKGAEKSLDDFEKSAAGSAKGIEKAFGALKVAAAAAVAVFAGRAVINGISSVVDAAAEADQAVRNLGVALASTGEFSDEAVSSLEDFASEIQRTTTFSDDAVLSSLALAKSFGVTNDQAQELVKAATDLSAATGKDLDTAVKELGNTYSGATGKLSKQIPELKKLNEEQLKSGAAIAIVQKAFEDAAKAQASGTFEGAIKKANNALGEISESIGKIITQNPVLIKVIDQFAAIFNSLSAFISQNQDTITTLLSKGLKALVAFIPNVIDAFTGLIAVVRVLLEATSFLIKGLVTFGSVVLEITKPIRDLQNILGNALIGAISKFVSAILVVAENVPGVSESLASIGVDLKKFRKEVDDFGDDRLDKALSLDTSASDNFQKFTEEALQDIFVFTDGVEKSVGSALDAVGEGSASLSIIAKTTSDNLNKVQDSSAKVTEGLKNGTRNLKDFTDGVAELEKVKGSFDKIKTQTEEITKELNKQTKTARELNQIQLQDANTLAENAEKELRALGKFNAETEKQIELFKEAAIERKKLADQNAPSQEFAEAKKTGDEIGKSISSVVSGGLDGAAGALTGALAGGLSVLGAVNGVLDFVQGLIDAIPNLLSKVTKIFDTLTDLPDKILEGVINLVKSIDRFLGSFVQNLFRVLPELIRVLAKAIFDTLPEAISELAKALPDIITQFIQDLEELIPPLAEKLAEQAPKIALALVDALVLKGGAIRIGFAIAKAMNNPQLYLGIARGFRDGIANTGTTIANQFKAGVANVGKEAGSDFSNKVKETFAQLYTVIISAFQQAGSTLAQTITNAFGGIYKTITDAFIQGGRDIFVGIENGAIRLRDELFKPINRLIEFLGNFKFPDISGSLSGISGGGGGIFGQVTGALSEATGGLFATGGQVPAGFPNDSFPARLTSGELVIPPGDTARLSQFLDRQTGVVSGGSDVQLTLLAQILAALQSPINVSTTAEVNGRALADIMLQLNRQNARVSA